MGRGVIHLRIGSAVQDFDGLCGRHGQSAAGALIACVAVLDDSVALALKVCAVM